MSVQGTAGTTRRIRDDRHRTLKVVAFWGFLFIASFVFGMLIVSPLLTATGFGEQKAAAPETLKPNADTLAPQPSPSGSAAVTPKLEESKPRKTIAPSIEISSEP